ncbi:thioredoxin domain-containing protein [Desulfoscipio sp. XC116]|uniref:thioredoxin domain-containing protein n=1 Tax=Desulfoscipio sp. XC116 TaxID=3144975 RepID=UPI00325B7195
MPTDKNRVPNRLSREKSPYLLQHAYNPVDWYPWCEEAFAKAKNEDKPIFLSIGYSTCHWCHVMERESFEDEEVAAALKRNFISIKVDREERPDIDQIYMTVCQAMTGQGGWPLTILMTPDKKPFFAGTYFPKRSRWGRAGLLDILEQVTDRWAEDREKLIQISHKITGQVQFTPDNQLSDEPPAAITTQGYQQFRQSFDKRYGGFGSAPKFPTPHNMLFLMRYWKQTGEDAALDMAKKTLQSIYRGGINDQVGFGFARYSTDAKWLVPHFEKMLYDNALLALAFLEAYQATQDDFYARAARQIFTYVLRDMTHPEGGFYSAEDADSEGVEGKFYVWSPAEVRQILGRENGDIYCKVYDITESGNFEGKNIPNLIAASTDEFVLKLGIEHRALLQLLDEGRQKLFEYRSKRVHPFKDDKILTAWNGLMIAALARGAAVLGESRCLKAAEKAEQFIRHKLQRSDGRLLARHRDDESDFNGYLDDYAFLIWGLLELYRATFQVVYLSRAIDLTHQVRDLFWDSQRGGFFFYGADSEQLIARPKEIYDGAMPSGNSVMAMNLLQLAAITGDSELDELAQRQINVFAGSAAEHPRGYAYFMTALLYAGGPSSEIVITGQRDDPQVAEMLRLAQRQYAPGAVIIYRPEGNGGEQIEKLAPHTRKQRSIDGRATAYVCRDRACREPVTETAALGDLLQ